MTSGSGGDRPPINDTAVAYRLDGGDQRAGDVDLARASTASTRWRSPSGPSTSVATSSGTSRRRLRTRGPAWTTSGYGTGQGLAAYALGDAVVRRDHLGALNPADGKALEWHPRSNSFEGNKAMEATPRGLLTGGDAGSRVAPTSAASRSSTFDQLPAASDPDTTIVGPIAGRVVRTNTRSPSTEPRRRPAPCPGPGRGPERQPVPPGQHDDLEQRASTPSTLRARARRPAARTPWSLPLTIARREMECGHVPSPPRHPGPGQGDQEDRDVQLRRPAADHQHLVAEQHTPDLDLVRAARQRLRRQGRQLGRALHPGHATDRYLTEDGDLVDGYTTFSIEPDNPGAISTTWQHEVDPAQRGQLEDRRDGARHGRAERHPLGDARVHRGLLGPGAEGDGRRSRSRSLRRSRPDADHGPGGRVTFTGTATDDQSLATVEVSLRNSTTREGLASDGTWGADVSRAGTRSRRPT